MFQRGTKFRNISLAGAITLLCSLNNSAGAVECVLFLRMHGLLRWASNRCAFAQYNPAIVETARQCFDHLGASAAAPLMWAGRDEFERAASVRGLEPFCAEIERKFPMVVRSQGSAEH